MASFQAVPSSLLPRAWSRALINSIPLPFRTPATQATLRAECFPFRHFGLRITPLVYDVSIKLSMLFHHLLVLLFCLSQKAITPQSFRFQ